MEMIRRKNIAILTGIFSLIVLFCGINYGFAADSFRFIASGDTVDGGSNVSGICDQIRAMTDAQPDIIILGGDIGPDSTLKSNMGSLHGKTFPVRATMIAEGRAGHPPSFRQKFPQSAAELFNLVFEERISVLF